MSVVSVDDFVATIGRSGLIADDSLQQFLARADCPSGNLVALSEALITAGLLTPWQTNKLLAGKHRGFFLGKYKILAQLGAGAMGRVFLAEHRLMRHRVAIKTMAKQLLGSDVYLKRFQHEAQAAAAVDHPRVVRAFDFDSDKDVYFLVMEYVDGEDLQKIVHRDGIMPVPVAAECIRQTAEGLEAIHIEGLVHRDVKPSNLLVDSEGNIRILDLGVARMNEQNVPSLTLLQDSKVIGTVDYLAPEQARNSHMIDSRADLYSLGCTFYFLLTGRAPFVKGTLTERLIDHQTKPPLDIRKLRVEVPAELAYLCHKLLAKDPNDRIQTAANVASALGDWLRRYNAAIEGGATAAGPRQAPVPTASASSRTAEGEELTLAEDDETQPNEAALGSTAPSLSATSPAPAHPCDSAPPPSADEQVPADCQSNVLDQLPLFPLESDPLNSAESPAISDSSLSDPYMASQHALTSQLESATCRAANHRPAAGWRQAIQGWVATETERGVSYAVWFLITAGMLLGILVCIVGFSYLQSTKETEVIRNRSAESASRDVFPFDGR